MNRFSRTLLNEKLAAENHSRLILSSNVFLLAMLLLGILCPIVSLLTFRLFSSPLAILWAVYAIITLPVGTTFFCIGLSVRINRQKNSQT